MLTSRPIRPLLVAALVALSSLMGANAVPAARAVEPLPECRYDDVMTSHTAYSEWRVTLLDTIYRVPRSYTPPGLMSTQNARLNKGGKVRRLVINDLAALAAAARGANAGVRVVSAYRSYSTQASVYAAEVRRYGERRAKLTVARPGHSEHQLGTTIDFGSARSSKDAWDYSDWAQTPAGAWMKQNAWKYGFLMSYPKGKRSVTCYRYEPWHYRYVGRDLAAKVHNSGLTLREYLWYHFEQ